MHPATRTATTLAATLFASGLLFPPICSAALITGVKARASSEFNGRPAVAAVNGAGLSGTDHSTGVAEMWLGASGDTTGTFEVDLGAVYDVSTLRIWNYNEANLANRGIATANIDRATVFGVYTTEIADQAFALAPGAPGDFAESIDLGGAAARYIRLDILSNHGDGSFTGISELQFDGDIAVGQQLPIPIVTTTATSEFGGREAIHATDGSGLFGPTHRIAPTGNMWLSNRVADPDITFDFGSVQAIGAIVLWNYNETLAGREAELLGRGIKDVDIQTSDNGVDFTTLKPYSFAIAPGDGNAAFGEEVALDVAARYVKLDVLNNHGNADGFTGISEVQFFAPTADTDNDNLPDVWEELFFPGDLTQLTGLKAGPGPGADSGDFDGDGLSDLDENGRGTIPNDDDTDGDSLLDGDEVAGVAPRPATNPKSADTDGDTLSDGAETNTGVFINLDDTGTDPTKRDSDGDSFADNVEVDRGSDPTDPDDFPLATLVGYWPFDADADPQPDLSPFGNDAAVNGAATWADDAERGGGVMQLNGGVGLQAAHSDSLSIDGAITIAAWVKPTLASGWDGIVAKSPAGALPNYPGNYELRLHTLNRNMEMLWESSPNAIASVTDPGNAVADNVWTHIAFSATPGGTYTFYINGIATSSGPMPDNFGGQNTNPLYIGNRADATTTAFDGCLDDVAIFAGQMPASQVADIMAGNFSAFGLGSSDFKITSVVKGTTLVGEVPTPSVALTFNSRPGRNYIIEASTSLKPGGELGGWIELDDGFASQGEETTYIDTLVANAPGVSRVFYRVRLAQ